MPSAAKAKRQAAKQAVSTTQAHQVQLVFPASLTPRQRAAIHAVGELNDLAHSSSGEGSQRQVALGPPGVPTVQLAAPEGLTDVQLIGLIQEHLGLDVSAAFTNFVEKPPAKAAQTGRKPCSDGLPALSAPLDVEKFVALMIELLELEHRAEVASAEDALSAATPEAAQARGAALLNLRVVDAEGGLLGRTLLTLTNNKGGSETLPPHKFSPHDIVRLRPNKGDAGAATTCEGVVYRVKDAAITVAVEDAPDEGLDVPLRLEKLANVVTHQRLTAAMHDLRSAVSGPAAALIDVLCGRCAPRFAASPPPWTAVNPCLDESQRRAVSLGLAAADVALIQGPPGCGKTTTVVELICQEVARGARVLACAASNIAVDNLVERLAAQRLAGGHRLGVVRVGHPARLLPAVLDSSLEAQVLRSDNSALARDCREEIKQLSRRLLKLTGRDRDERREIRAELRRLRKEERQRQQRAVGEVLASARVLCATLTGVGTRQLAALPPFDMVVIDEAAQALEPACWAALLRGRRAVLVGDHFQLPPTVTCEAAARRGLLTTMFERLHATWGQAASEMLTVQYRMNSAIMEWSSQEMYQGRLEAAEAVAGHTLAELPGASPGADPPVLLLIDTAGCDNMEEASGGEGGRAMNSSAESKCNEGEARAAMQHVRRLMAAGIKAEDIGVITPYSAQVGLLRELRSECGSAAAAVEISTVDGFQGREKEAIVISAVRCNPKGEVGFLADNRRMNVAVTRARRHCALVGDTETLGNDPFLARLVHYFEEHGEYASAQEYLDEC